MSNNIEENEDTTQQTVSNEDREVSNKDASLESSKQQNVVEKNQSSVVEEKQKNELTIKSDNDLASLDYVDFNTPAKMMALGKILVQSQLIPLKKKEDVVTALMTGKELGLPFITSISQIYPINGRPTLGVHIQKALCLKQGIIFEKVEDAEGIYQFVATDKEGKVLIEDKQPVIVHTGVLSEQPDNTKKREITKRTKIKATRMIKRPDGSFREMVAYGEFSLLDAQQAELLDKDVWKKFWKRMLEARAYTNVIKEIASDITLGMSTPMELSNEFYLDEDGNETIIDVT